MASLGLGFVAERAVADLLESGIDLFADLPSGVLHAISLVIALAIVVTLHMVLGEMVPKNIAISGPERVARALAPIHRTYVVVLGPVVWALNAASTGLVRMLGLEPVDELNTALTVNEFHTLLAGARDEGVIEESEHDLLAGALGLRARTAGSLIVPAFGDGHRFTRYERRRDRAHRGRPRSHEGAGMGLGSRRHPRVRPRQGPAPARHR